MDKKIKSVIRESLQLDEPLNEAYMAHPKQYLMNTDMLLSKTKDSHKELYEGYVKSLNDLSAKVDVSDKKNSSSNHSEFRSLKIDEQYNLNAVYLHELYFANISDPYSEIAIDSLAHMRLNKDFGNFDNWQHDFIACAMAARNGWVVTALSFYLKRFVNIIVDGHDQNILLGNYPLIALDMWEHARKDYQNDKKRYVYSMMKELNWNVIEERFKRADIIYQALIGGSGKNSWA